MNFVPIPADPVHPEDLCPADMTDLEAVWSWVNVQDELWQAEALKYGCPVKKYVGGEGDADVFDSLQYSMRSVRKNLPFVKKFIVVTALMQVPSWLNKEFPEVQIIHHDQFLHQRALPTFNSQPMEYSIPNLHRKGFVKKCFLYLNDDFLVMKPMGIKDFIDEEGRIKLYSYIHRKLGKDKYADLPNGLASEDEALHGEYIDPHVPYTINANLANRLVDECGKDCEKMYASKCSRQHRLFPSNYHDYVMKRFDEGAVTHVSPYEGLFNRAPLGLPEMTIENNLRLIKWMDPKFVYIASHAGIETNPVAVRYVKEFLHSNFPDPLPWEKP